MTDLAPVRITLPPALLRLFPEAYSPVEVHAGTISDVLDALDARWPGIRDRLRDSTPAIRRNIAVFVDGQRADLLTRLGDGSEVFVTTRISGG